MNFVNPNTLECYLPVSGYKGDLMFASVLHALLFEEHSAKWLVIFEV